MLRVRARPAATAALSLLTLLLLLFALAATAPQPASAQVAEGAPQTSPRATATAATASGAAKKSKGRVYLPGQPIDVLAGRYTSRARLVPLAYRPAGICAAPASSSSSPSSLPPNAAEAAAAAAMNAGADDNDDDERNLFVDDEEDAQAAREYREYLEERAELQRKMREGVSTEYNSTTYKRLMERRRRVGGLGQMLLGTRRVQTPYVLAPLRNQLCAVACVDELPPDPKSFADKDSAEAKAARAAMKQATKRRRRLLRLVRGKYRGSLYLDGLPASTFETPWELGYPLGYTADATTTTTTAAAAASNNQKDKAFAATAINNHLSFLVHYVPVTRRDGKPGVQIVHFAVRASSHAVSPCDTAAAAGADVANGVREDPAPNEAFGAASRALLDLIGLGDGDGGAATTTTTAAPATLQTPRITYSYSVVWRPAAEGVTWARRWQTYRRTMTSDEVTAHDIGIAISVLLTIVVAASLYARIAVLVKRDLANYAEKGETDDLLLIAAITGGGGGEGGSRAGAEGGWRAVHGDVFRKPPRAGLLAALAGTGAQCLYTAAVVLSAGAAGLLGREGQEGRLSTMVLVLFVLGAAVNGFVTAFFTQVHHIRSLGVVAAAALLFPAAALVAHTGLSVIYAIAAGAGGPGLTGTALAVGCLFACLALALAGGVAGYRLRPLKLPGRINTIMRTVPPLPWHLQALPSCVGAALLPFAATAGETHHAVAAAAQMRTYSLYGYLLLACASAVALAGLGGVLATYRRLNAHEHRWWWTAAGVGGGYGAWFVLYSLLYALFASDLSGPLAFVLFCGYLLIASSFLALAVGAVSFISTFFFVRYIYSVVRID